MLPDQNDTVLPLLCTSTRDRTWDKVGGTMIPIVWSGSKREARYLAEKLDGLKFRKCFEMLPDKVQSITVLLIIIFSKALVQHLMSLKRKIK